MQTSAKEPPRTKNQHELQQPNSRSNANQQQVVTQGPKNHQKTKMTPRQIWIRPTASKPNKPNGENTRYDHETTWVQLELVSRSRNSKRRQKTRRKTPSHAGAWKTRRSSGRRVRNHAQSERRADSGVPPIGTSWEWWRGAWRNKKKNFAT